MKNKHQIIDGVLFLRGNEGAESTEFKEIFGLSATEARKILKEYKEYFNAHNEDRGVIVIEHADVFKYATKPELKDDFSDFVTLNKKRRLSDSAMEAMAIIAYKQPVSKNDIAKIRGVNSDGVVSTLLAKNLIEEVGISDKPGKPILYGITKLFYDYFQISSLKELPEIREWDERSTEETFDILETHEYKN